MPVDPNDAAAREAQEFLDELAALEGDGSVFAADSIPTVRVIATTGVEGSSDIDGHGTAHDQVFDYRATA